MNRRHHRRSKKHQLAPPGTPPGVLIADPRAKKPEIRMSAYGPEQFEERTIAHPKFTRECLHQHPVVCFEVDGLGDVESVCSLGNTFYLHPLSLECVRHVFQR